MKSQQDGKQGVGGYGRRDGEGNIQEWAKRGDRTCLFCLLVVSEEGLFVASVAHEMWVRG